MALFKDLLKKWFYTNSSKAASNDARIPMLTSTGEPKGSDTMANLASVLGETWFAVASIYDCNQAPLNKTASVSGSLLNTPTGASNGFVYTFANTIGNNVDYTMQLYWTFSSKQLFARIESNGVWGNWGEIVFNIPSFYKNYANLNALTNALVAQNALSIGNVMVVTNADSYTRFWPADRALESGIANIAVGAGIIENGRTLIIAKDTTTKKWAESNVAGGNSYLGREAAVADFNGRTNTNKILETLGDNAPAATYCHTYHPANVDSADTNMGAGRWWLPSLGELAMIWAHVREINFVLSAIGGTQIPVGSGWMWSSTEGSATGAWSLLTYLGFFGGNGKTSETSVRPVSAFY